MGDRPAMADEATGRELTPERWRRIREILDAVLPLNAEERERYLAQETDADPGLRAEVESLLAMEAEAEQLLPTGSPLAGIRITEETAPLPNSLGPYRIIGEAGHGGMGVVYRAERVDGQYSKQVAIKLLPALYSRTELERRFLRERQILARLEHPNVARLLDGGVAPDGRPYLVMEYVDGEPIATYAGTHRLNVTQRVRLFLELCEAVAYAHRNFIVHRDLKPSNVLVAGDGRVKLLDFGLARILDAASANPDLTQTALNMMTPSYASPEQIRGEPITAASDVFSLGVILFELLAGRRPFGAPGQTAAQVQRAVCEVDPPPPGKAAPREDGSERLSISQDLDRVVLKALAKDAGRRYSSVDSFAQDLRMYLEGRPVSARRAGVLYRSWKFVRRNRVPVALAALALIGTITGLIVALRQARIAQAERARAERRFNDVRKLANSFLFEFHDSIANLKGATPARALIIKRAREYLASLSQDSPSDPELLRELARSYVMLGDILGEMSFANLGDTRGSIESYQQAEALHRALMKATPPSAQNRRGLMVIQQRMAMAYMKTGRPNLALQVLESAGKTAEELAAANPGSDQAVGDLFVEYERLATAYDKLGNAAKKEEISRKLLHVATRLTEMKPANQVYTRGVMLASAHLGQALPPGSPEAAGLFRRARDIAGKLSAANPDDGEAQTDLGITETFEAEFLAKSGKADEALRLARNGQMRLDRIAQADPENIEARQAASQGWHTLGEVYSARSEYAQAVSSFQHASELLETAAGKDTLDFELRSSLARSYLSIGEAREHLRGCPDALPWYDKSRQAWTALSQQAELAAPSREIASKAGQAAARCSEQP